MTLKEKMTYSFMAISVVLGNSSYAADKAADKHDDSALFGKTSQLSTVTQHRDSGPSSLGDFDASIFGDCRSLLNASEESRDRTPPPKSKDDEVEHMHLPDAPLAPVSSSFLPSAAAAAKKEDATDKHRDDREDEAEQTTVDSEQMSVQQALQLLSLASSSLLGPNASIQVSGIIPGTEESSVGGGACAGLIDIFDEKDKDKTVREEEHSSPRHAHHESRREDHHSDHRKLGPRGVFQEPLGKDSCIPDLLERELGGSSISHSRTVLSSMTSQQKDLTLKLSLYLLRYSGLEEPTPSLVTERLVESLSNNSFRTALEAGNVCIELLDFYSRSILFEKSKKRDIKPLLANRTSVMSYIESKVTENITFADSAFKIIEQDRFYRTAHKILTEESVGTNPEEQLIFTRTKGSVSLQYDTLTLAGVWVYQAVLMPVTDVLIRTYDLGEITTLQSTRLQSIVPTLLRLNAKLIEAEGVYNFSDQSRHGKKAQVALDKWILKLIGIHPAPIHSSSSAAAQERVEEKTVAKQKTDHT